MLLFAVDAIGENRRLADVEKCHETGRSVEIHTIWTRFGMIVSNHKSQVGMLGDSICLMRDSGRSCTTGARRDARWPLTQQIT